MFQCYYLNKYTWKYSKKTYVKSCFFIQKITMQLTIHPGVKFVLPNNDPHNKKLNTEFNYFVSAVEKFHGIELSYHPNSPLGWLPPYYIVGDPVWLDNQYYRDQIRVHYRHCRTIMLWDVGYEEVDYSAVKDVFYDKNLILVTDKLIKTEYPQVNYDWQWNHFKYYATQDVMNSDKFWNYRDYHMHLLLAEKLIANVLRFDGGSGQLRDVLFSDCGGQITDSDDFMHTMVSVVEEPIVGFKTYYALSRGHLVLPFTSDNQVKKLASKGFYLSDLFDFSFDQRLDYNTRLETFVESVLKFMSGNSKYMMQDWYKTNLDRLRANQKIFFDCDYDISLASMLKSET